MSIRVGWMLTQPLDAPVLQRGSQLEDVLMVSQTNPGSETATFGLKIITNGLQSSYCTGEKNQRTIFKAQGVGKETSTTF